MIELPVCHWRKSHDDPTKVTCKSPKIIAPKGVKVELCSKCILANHSLDNTIVQQLNIKIVSNISLPCLHKGKNVPPPEGRDIRKQWYICEMGLGIVSKCMCNKKRCNEYEADDTTESL